MQPSGTETLEDAIRRLDARLHALGNLGIDLSRPSRRLLEDLRARRGEMRQRHVDLEIVEELHLGVDPADRVLEDFGFAR